ncbi:MAG: rhomboid family intramembrane serine protease, partial [Phycisphaeraceae bacterium]
MFFPIRTDRRLAHTPWVNYTLIAVNVLVFILQIALSSPGRPQWFGHGLLDPEAPSLHQFITYQFLHGSWEHLLGNMLFLYVFGNSVEDRLGKIGYLGFYLAGGVIAGFGHALLETTPVLGASGAICAVTGAYLALFPLSGVTIFYWFVFYVGTFEVSGIVLICFQIAQDLLFQLAGRGGVAYMAHLAGYAYGLLIGMGLLWCRLLA